jgi:hypothetical protein
MTRTTRREFAMTLAAAAACPPLVPFSNRLSERELESVEQNLAEAKPALERLRAIPLTNADEPDFVR